MILPIVAYGDAILKKVALEITPDYLELNLLIKNMFDTMYNASGIGLAAPQVGQSLRLFIVDTAQILNKKKSKAKGNMTEEDEDEPLKKDEKGIVQLFINPTIKTRTGQQFEYNEGCLSIPSIREDITRYSIIEIEYFDEQLVKHTARYEGLAARVIQHEFDHIEGILFTDYLKPLRRTMLKGKLENISKGKIEADYRMYFPNAKKR